MGSTYSSDNPLSFALFGLSRQAELPVWRRLDWGYPILHLGPGDKIVRGAEELDYPAFDFDDPEISLPYDDGSVGGVIATHVLEHLADPRPLIREVARVLNFGCPFNILVPHGQSPMYLQDLDHKTPFVLDTWKNFLHNGFYDNNYGEGGVPLSIGANFKFALKEGNEAIITQLIKE
ncbi:methyltransferase [Mycobacterium phage Chill]|uniref:Methyltransferase n=13 Tax=Plotvirus TaxID=2169613 RepID=B5U429_9CAUD|nr:methyltransferase [Mycobacterium phage Troll4]YP_655256.1 methyltransferase [Mycobacterium phage PBI1]ACD49647.1 methyltransferase [Mycobacterium phage Adjutor]ACI06350.1 methyltransferase [Mycobacterium phage Butterscotch]AVP43160.1 methyltransferase [Mycobacterium phage BigMama]AWY03506.1 methyltransferase [Mycobacterium phage Erk16]AXC38556.1 methyltransferase [Mycobacterium phage Visconti]QBI97130.1 methyltransferase [Mycobacterium phage Chill]QBJ04779.1 methyltransferase [Mycobacter